ncbi:hypothetical protein BDZ94DRAFT_1306973 [Collybia nuda]|uniref:Uncharacterized protein n=1 Tax=Collybia nuda TaxID=64659 RepID=A0A9P5YD13_9AGAR|nr:hypothetical protein BDZ94DRAFT_1306973 [Collybia nuda]
MNAPFDVNGAREALEVISEETTNGLSLSNMLQGAVWSDGIKVNRVDHPTTWRLLRGINEDQEELVFTIRGVIIAKDLPPVLQRPRLSAGRYKYLRQSLTISGLGTTKFDQALAAATEIYGAFDRTFPDGQLESWSASGFISPGDFSALDASNRYMIPRRDVPKAQHQPFPPHVDPKRILEEMAIGSEHVHTEENSVFYFTSHLVGPGKRTFVDAPPQTFRIGDIVEVQVSFVAVPLKGDQYKMLTILHSIALLDGSFGQSASMIKKAQQTTQVIPKILVNVKRRIGYGSMEVESEGGGKRSRMEVDDVAKPLVAGFTNQLHFGTTSD